MFIRRTAMTMIGTAALLAVLWPTGYARAQPGPVAVIFVQSTAEQLVAVVNSAGSLDERRQRLRQIIDATVDVDEIARFCLGHFWQITAPDQQKQYLAVFHDLLVIEIAGHLGEYNGVRVTVGPARMTADTEIVASTVERPNGPTMQVDWVVSTATSNPRIVDLLAGGTSMRLTKGADFSAYLARHQYNVRELVEALRQISGRNG
jgi:phospholipid transport system substrate-binding protein